MASPKLLGGNINGSGRMTTTNSPASTSSHVWFAGLNGLRFLAAVTVVIMHMHSNLERVGLPQLPAFPILFKGHAAVSFFFVLSGFLITYLLLEERVQTGRISVRNFYLRRVFRIWPLYITVIVFGLFFFWVVVPPMGVEFEIRYDIELAVLLYTLFLANLMNSLYHMGGMLHITWSIAVEEQFYLAWAPVVKKFFVRRLPAIIVGVIIVSATVNILNALDVFGLGAGLKGFVYTLQFHYMGLGAGAAWMLYYRRDSFLALAHLHHHRGPGDLPNAAVGLFFRLSKVGRTPGNRTGNHRGLGAIIRLAIGVSLHLAHHQHGSKPARCIQAVEWTGQSYRRCSGTAWQGVLRCLYVPRDCHLFCEFPLYESGAI